MIHGKWVYGALIQQFWTMADTGGDPAAVDGAVWSRHHTHDSIQRTANPVRNPVLPKRVSTRRQSGDAASHDCQPALPDEEIGTRREIAMAGIVLVLWFIEARLRTRTPRPTN
jgi:hypothetical protein